MSKRPFISQQSQTLKKKKLEEEGGVKEVISSNNEQKNKKIDFEALFADDDDAPKNRRLPPLSSKLGDLSALKSTLKKDTVDTMTDIPEEKAKNDEEDSLDAFMSDIAKVEEKVVPKVRRDDIEDEDDMETFFKHREKELKKQEEQLQLAPNFNENEEEYDSDDLASAAVKMVCYFGLLFKFIANRNSFHFFKHKREKIRNQFNLFHLFIILKLIILHSKKNFIKNILRFLL